MTSAVILPRRVEGAWSSENEEESRTCGFYDWPTGRDWERNPVALYHRRAQPFIILFRTSLAQQNRSERSMQRRREQFGRVTHRQRPQGSGENLAGDPPVGLTPQ
jgi:hypothetical protein